MRKIKKLVLTLNLLLVLVTALAFLSPSIHPSSNTIPGLLGLLLPLWLVLNVVFIVLWGVFKEWYILFSIAILVLGWNRISAFMQISPKADATGTELSIATYNVFQFQNALEGQSRSQAAQEIISQLGNPDVLCLQEALGVSTFLDDLPYDHHFRVAGSLNYILSKHPIVAADVLDFKEEGPLSGWADISWRDDTIRIYTLYLTSSRVTAETEHLIDGVRLQDQQTWKDIGMVLSKYRKASVPRAAQADIVATHINTSPHPVIVCGDFNDVPQSYTYSAIGSALKDSFIARGRGTGTTYGGGIPGLRIDYIMADPDFDIVSHEVLKLESSDHYPVKVGIRITDL